jgi:Flagellar biosynthesis protein, FliO
MNKSIGLGPPQAAVGPGRWPLWPGPWRDWSQRLRTTLGISGGDARIVQALPLGPGARLLVVEFGGRRLLIGQSRAGLARLAAADAPGISP